MLTLSRPHLPCYRVNKTHTASAVAPSTEHMFTPPPGQRLWGVFNVPLLHLLFTPTTNMLRENLHSYETVRLVHNSRADRLFSRPITTTMAAP
jgi:hypothetical protein